MGSDGTTQLASHRFWGIAAGERTMTGLASNLKSTCMLGVPAFHLFNIVTVKIKLYT